MDELNFNNRLVQNIQNILDETRLVKEGEYLAQNKRDHKVEITDIAITKVPYIMYPGLSVDEALKVHELAQQVLYVSKNENNSNEVTITYSLEHEWLEKMNEPYMTIVKGKENETDVMADTETYHLINTADDMVIVSLHNHPSNSGFSMFDIAFFLQYDSIRLMVLLSNQGKLSYISKNDNYSRLKSVISFADIISTEKSDAYVEGVLHLKQLSLENMRNISTRFIRKASGLGIDYKIARGNDKELML